MVQRWSRTGPKVVIPGLFRVAKVAKVVIPGLFRVAGSRDSGLPDVVSVTESSKSDKSGDY